MNIYILERFGPVRMHACHTLAITDNSSDELRENNSERMLYITFISTTLL